MSGADKGPAPSADQLPLNAKHAAVVGNKYGPLGVSAFEQAYNVEVTSALKKAMTAAYIEGASDAWYGNTYPK